MPHPRAGRAGLATPPNPTWALRGVVPHGYAGHLGAPAWKCAGATPAKRRVVRGRDRPQRTVRTRGRAERGQRRCAAAPRAFARYPRGALTHGASSCVALLPPRTRTHRFTLGTHSQRAPQKAGHPAPPTAASPPDRPLSSPSGSTDTPDPTFQRPHGRHTEALQPRCSAPAAKALGWPEAAAAPPSAACTHTHTLRAG